LFINHCGKNKIFQQFFGTAVKNNRLAVAIDRVQPIVAFIETMFGGKNTKLFGYNVKKTVAAVLLQRFFEIAAQRLIAAFSHSKNRSSF
jgi:hypothetical protein